MASSRRNASCSLFICKGHQGQGQQGQFSDADGGSLSGMQSEPRCCPSARWRNAWRHTIQLEPRNPP